MLADAEYKEAIKLQLLKIAARRRIPLESAGAVLVVLCGIGAHELILLGIHCGRIDFGLDDRSHRDRDGAEADLLS